MFNDKNVNLDNIRYWWVRRGRAITIHFQLSPNSGFKKPLITFVASQNHEH